MSSVFMSGEEAQMTAEIECSALHSTASFFLESTSPAHAKPLLRLSAAGKEAALSAASIYRFNFSAQHIDALLAVWARGPDGLAPKLAERGQYEKLCALSRVTISDCAQQMLAASMSGNEGLYEDLRHQNYLVHLEQPTANNHHGDLDRWRLTNLGRALLVSYHHVSGMMLRTYAAKHGAVLAEDATPSLAPTPKPAQPGTPDVGSSMGL